jgi:hypothetical protein
LHGGTSCQMVQTCCLLMYHPFIGDIIFNSLVAYSMGTGQTRMAPGQKTGKDGGKDRSEKPVWLSGFHNAIGGLALPPFSGGKRRDWQCQKLEGPCLLPAHLKRWERHPFSLALLYFHLFLTHLVALYRKVLPLSTERFAVENVVHDLPTEQGWPAQVNIALNLEHRGKPSWTKPLLIWHTFWRSCTLRSRIAN